MVRSRKHGHQAFQRRDDRAPGIGARAWCLAAFVVMASPATGRAHAGPPFPLAEDRGAGPYSISVWTDPDVTEDGSAGGQFWIMLRSSDAAELPDDTRVTLSVQRRGGEGVPSSRAAEASLPAVRLKAGKFFGVLKLSREGPFEMTAVVESSRGSATLTLAFEATYDSRPSPLSSAIFLFPFVAVGGLWMWACRRRRAALAATP